MKVYIIGLDGLELIYVKLFNLSKLKQKEYGKVIIPLIKGKALTSVIWGSFLTGKVREDLKVGLEWNNFVLNFLHKHLKTNIGVGLFLERLGFRRGIPKVDNSILDFGGIAFNFPCINYDFQKDRAIIFDWEKNKITKKKLKEILTLKFTNEIEMAKKILKQKTKIYLMYFHFLDWVNHFFFSDYDFIKKSYFLVEKKVNELMDKIRSGDIIFILSDHGGIDGKHTNYGFYSVNHK
jgi:hypothetical protein